MAASIAIGVRAYPRVCGGIGARIMITTRAAGLSPRVRGNQPIEQCNRPDPGPIPACAGESGVVDEIR